VHGKRLELEVSSPILGIDRTHMQTNTNVDGLMLSVLALSLDMSSLSR
jgi:hypothetical protein